MDPALHWGGKKMFNELESTQRRQDLSINRKKREANHGFNGPALRARVPELIPILVHTSDPPLEQLSVELLQGRDIVV
jgi:hypothetical protein